MSDKRTPGRGWTDDTARWFNDAIRYSTYPEKALEVIQPLLRAGDRVLDIGAGVGALCLPLASRGFRITAVEPAAPMADLLRAEANSAGVGGSIRIIRKKWRDAKVRPHDVAIAANLPPDMSGDPDFLESLDRAAARTAIVIRGVNSKRQKFFYDELYPLLFNKKWKPFDDYLATYTALHRLGIYADVKIISHAFDQRFRDLDEALDFWRGHLKLKTHRHDAALKEFLDARLETLERPARRLKVRKKSAVIRWIK